MVRRSFLLVLTAIILVVPIVVSWVQAYFLSHSFIPLSIFTGIGLLYVLTLIILFIKRSYLRSLLAGLVASCLLLVYQLEFQLTAHPTASEFSRLYDEDVEEHRRIHGKPNAQLEICYSQTPWYWNIDIGFYPFGFHKRSSQLYVQCAVVGILTLFSCLLLSRPNLINRKKTQKESDL